MRKPLSLLSILLLSLLSSRALAWNATGHRVVAMIAWEDLTPKTRAAITALLQQHPRYVKDLLSNAPPGAGPDVLAKSAFATAATWPDMVRNPANPMSASHNHPAWHYIDIPYYTGGATTRPAPLAIKGPANIIEALKQCTAELKDPATHPATMAVDICWVEHLVGDLHQPLHAVSWYSPQFPTGDQGGNAEEVLKNPPYPDSAIKLHTLWDGLMGDFLSDDFVRFEESGLRADAAYSRDADRQALTVTDFAAWANESHELAIKDVYLNGTLRTTLVSRDRFENRSTTQSSTRPTGAFNAGGPPGGAPDWAPRRDRRASTQPIAGLTPEYLQNAEQIALRRISLAGYRLADVLNGIFDPK